MNGLKQPSLGPRNGAGKNKQDNCSSSLQLQGIQAYLLKPSFLWLLLRPLLSIHNSPSRHTPGCNWSGRSSDQLPQAKNLLWGGAGSWEFKSKHSVPFSSHASLWQTEIQAQHYGRHKSVPSLGKGENMGVPSAHSKSSFLISGSK